MPALRDIAPDARILLIRPTALGDVSRTVPALATLRRAFPQARIDWLVHDAFAEIIRHHPMLDGVVTFPRQRFGRLWRQPSVAREMWQWFAQLRRSRYDLVVDLQGLFRSGLFTWMTGSPCRLGFANARELGWLGYNHRHLVDAALHAVDRMLGLLAREGLDPVADMRLYLGPEARTWLGNWMAATGVASRRYALLAPTARWRSKCWPMDRFARIGRHLLDSGAVDRLCVLASPAERPQIEPLLRDLANTGRVAAPTTSIGQMAALISEARIVVCNDSAPLHIAVGFDRPLVAVFGPTDPALVGPYRRPEAVVRPEGMGALPLGEYRRRRNDQSLIARVASETVWERVQTVLRATAG